MEGLRPGYTDDSWVMDGTKLTETSVVTSDTAKFLKCDNLDVPKVSFGAAINSTDIEDISVVLYSGDTFEINLSQDTDARVFIIIEHELLKPSSSIREPGTYFDLLWVDSTGANNLAKNKYFEDEFRYDGIGGQLQIRQTEHSRIGNDAV